MGGSREIATRYHREVQLSLNCSLLVPPLYLSLGFLDWRETKITFSHPEVC